MHPGGRERSNFGQPRKATRSLVVPAVPLVLVVPAVPLVLVAFAALLAALLAASATVLSAVLAAFAAPFAALLARLVTSSLDPHAASPTAAAHSRCIDLRMATPLHRVAEKRRGRLQSEP
jgi:hypothetical protein